MYSSSNLDPKLSEKELLVKEENELYSIIHHYYDTEKVKNIIDDLLNLLDDNSDGVKRIISLLHWVNSSNNTLGMMIVENEKGEQIPSSFIALLNKLVFQFSEDIFSFLKIQNHAGSHFLLSVVKHLSDVSILQVFDFITKLSNINPGELLDLISLADKNGQSISRLMTKHPNLMLDYWRCVRLIFQRWQVYKSKQEFFKRFKEVMIFSSVENRSIKKQLNFLYEELPEKKNDLELFYELMKCALIPAANFHVYAELKEKFINYVLDINEQNSFYKKALLQDFIEVIQDPLLPARIFFLAEEIAAPDESYSSYWPVLYSFFYNAEAKTEIRNQKLNEDLLVCLQSKLEEVNNIHLDKWQKKYNETLFHSNLFIQENLTQRLQPDCMLPVSADVVEGIGKDFVLDPIMVEGKLFRI